MRGGIEVRLSDPCSLKHGVKAILEYAGDQTDEFSSPGSERIGQRTWSVTVEYKEDDGSGEKFLRNLSPGRDPEVSSNGFSHKEEPRAQGPSDGKVGD